MHRIALFVLPCLLLLLAPLPAGAEEEAFPEEVPPRLDEGPGAFRGEVERPDLIEYVRTLRRALEEYKRPAPKTQTVTALHDAWSKILKPRASRMTRRLAKWEDRKRWLVPEGETKPTGIAPDQWTQFTRDMASLATELHGAWKQYGTVQLREKRVGFGQATLPHPPRLTRFGYGHPVHYGGIRNRQVAGWGMGRWNQNSYWHLLNRFQGAWLYRLERRREYYEWFRKQEKMRRETFDHLRSELNNTRESLMENLLGVQALVAAMQNAEEARMGEHCGAYPPDDTLREMVEVAGKSLEDARLNAETFEGESSAAYGTLLRKWLRAHKAALKVLEVACVQAQEMAQDEEKDEVEEEPVEAPK